jgi:hypothetical protein
LYAIILCFLLFYLFHQVLGSNLLRISTAYHWNCLYRLVALLFNNNFQFVIKNTVCDENGRYIICELELSNERIIVTHFYGLNTDSKMCFL